MSIKYKYFIGFGMVLILLSACKQSDPPEPTVEEEKGDFSFSGFEWIYKHTTDAVGPGPNIFSKSSDNIWLDAQGFLHMKISKVDNEWHCSEVISTREVGYGTYIFTIASDLTTFNERAVLGLFTWDTYSFQSQANSEVDIEFSRWGSISDSTLLTYSVQPVWGSASGPYNERSIKPSMQVSKLQEVTTHVFEWTAEKISWKSYAGSNYPGTDLIASWEFDNTNQERRKFEGSNVSDPIVIPAPGDSTHARINLWLMGGQGPADDSETEVIIQSFNYIPQ